jgi:UDP-N-acetylmuramoyl-L-alanyl-D-glutamate--2,6-diaminopimelate ligase
VAVMEASSQALDLHRCDGLKFRAAIFTNLTRDHLDYHHTMENYFDAKKRLFDGRLGDKPEISVINADDEWGVKLAEELKENGQRVVTYGIDNTADFSAGEIDISLIKGTSFLLKTPRGERALTSPLVGRPHVYNILAASAAALELGYGIDDIAKGIETCVGAPGRFERVPHSFNGGDFAVVVDYAHTDDALLNTLKTARDLAVSPSGGGRIITVFGCGGDRDKSKRAPMGLAAGKYSDLAIITSDNPRTEDPLKIIAEVEAGIKETGTPYKIVSDRREAIRQAVKEARPGDVIIIAGKGHETYQIIGSDKFHFDDREVAKEALDGLEEK